jgi:transketolase
MNITNNTNDTDRLKGVKRLMIETSRNIKTGHIPSSLSSIEILYTLYNKVANITLENASQKDRDRVIISKEHCRLGQMAVMAECGLIKKEYLNDFMGNDSMLGHDIYGIVGKKGIETIDVSTGSLGHGPSVGCGLAYNSDSNIYVIVGDGEMQEGSCWEAVTFAGYHKLKNFTLIVDNNNQQIDDYTNNIVDTSSNIGDRIKTFGFEVFECDGHSVTDLEEKLKIKTDNPKCIVANTIKGKEMLPLLESRGFSVFHWETLTDEEYKIVMENIDE